MEELEGCDGSGAGVGLSCRSTSVAYPMSMLTSSSSRELTAAAVFVPQAVLLSQCYRLESLSMTSSRCQDEPRSMASLLTGDTGIAARTDIAEDKGFAGPFRRDHSVGLVLDRTQCSQACGFTSGNKIVLPDSGVAVRFILRSATEPMPPVGGIPYSKAGGNPRRPASPQDRRCGEREGLGDQPLPLSQAGRSAQSTQCPVRLQYYLFSFARRRHRSDGSGA